MTSNYPETIKTLVDAELRLEYTNLCDEGINYRSEPLSRDVFVSKLKLVTDEMRKRGI